MSEPMDAGTLEALKGSIRKWESIVEGTGLDRGPDNCPLCQKFNSDDEGENTHFMCDGCPVAKATGETGCHGSPYYEARPVVALPRNTTGGYDFTNHPERLEACKAELEFLRSLLPAKED